MRSPHRLDMRNASNKDNINYFKKVYPIFLDHEFNGVKLAVFKNENIYSFAEPPNPPKPIIAIMSSSVVSAAAELKLVFVLR